MAVITRMVAAAGLALLLTACTQENNIIDTTANSNTSMQSETLRIAAAANL